MRIGNSTLLVTLIVRRSRSGTSATSASPNRAPGSPGAERLAKHHEPGALVQQDLEPDLGDQLGTPSSARHGRGDTRDHVPHLLPGGTASGGQVDLVERRRDGLGAFSASPRSNVARRVGRR